MNSTMDILRMLEQLHELAVESPKSLGPIIWGLNRDEIAMQIAKIRASLPNEVKQAASLTRESERIVEGAREDAKAIIENANRDALRITQEAQAEADRLMEQAKLSQQQLVGESEILKLAKAQAEEVRLSADRDSMGMRRGAEDYAFAVLNRLEGILGKAIGTVEDGKRELDRAATPPLPVADVEETRERVRAI